MELLTNHYEIFFSKPKKDWDDVGLLKQNHYNDFYLYSLALRVLSFRDESVLVVEVVGPKQEKKRCKDSLQ